MTRVIQGAPGAGKTSILHEMQQRWTGEDGSPRVVVLSSDALARNVPLALRELLAAGMLSPESWRQALRENWKRVNSMGAFGFHLGMQVEGEPTDLHDLAKRHPAEEWKAPVIVAVDETQQLEGSRFAHHANILQSIHAGSTDLRLTLVLAGLSDTLARASEMDLTRGVTVHEVGCLAPVESRTLMEDLCRHFGMESPRCIPQLRDLAETADGWPRHLHHAAVALAEAGLETEGDPDRIDWARVKARARESRRAYYAHQRSPQMRKAGKLVAAVMRDLGDHQMTEGDVLDSIERHHDSSKTVGWRLPEDMTVDGFLNHLIHQGALYADDEGIVHSPIPSFRRYLSGKDDAPADSGRDG